MSATQRRLLSRPALFQELRANALAILLLIGTLAMVITAHVTASRTARRYSEFTNRALTEYAAMGGYYFARRAILGFEELATTYARFDGFRSPAKGPNVSRISREVDSLVRCKCAFYVAARGYATGVFGDSNSVKYRAVIRDSVVASATTETLGGALAQSEATPILAAKLAALRKIAARWKGLEWPVVVRVGGDSAVPWMLVVAPIILPSGSQAGFLAVDLHVEDWRDRVLNGTYLDRSTILSASLVGGLTNAEIAQFRVYSVQHGTVFYRPTINPSGIAASVPLDYDTALKVGIELSRAVAERSVRGAMPQSSMVLEFVLPFVAVSLVLAIALTVVRAERLARARSRFAASVSHELRTPLTHILLNAETLHYGRERDAAHREATAGIIAREARRLVYLVENVLQFSKAEHDVLRLRPRSIRVDLVVTDLADTWTALVEAAGATLEVDAHEAVWADADAAALQLVLTNIVDNALHHAPHSAIRVMIEQTADQAVITMDDDGPGIPLKERAELLQPFKRSSRAEVAHPTGAGIGLAVVVQLMQAMKGSMQMDTSPSNGLRIILRLPRARALGIEPITAAAT